MSIVSNINIAFSVGFSEVSYVFGRIAAIYAFLPLASFWASKDRFVIFAVVSVFIFVSHSSDPHHGACISALLFDDLL